MTFVTLSGACFWITVHNQLSVSPSQITYKVAKRRRLNQENKVE